MTSSPQASQPQRIDAAIRDILGDTDLRPGQREAIEAALSGDALAVLATGSGKSLVYRVAGAVLGGTTVVICPTLSLQMDQLAALHEDGPRPSWSIARNQPRPVGRRWPTSRRVGSGSCCSRRSRRRTPRCWTRSTPRTCGCSSLMRLTASAPGATTSAPTICTWARSRGSWAARRSSR